RRREAGGRPDRARAEGAGDGEGAAGGGAPGDGGGADPVAGRRPGGGGGGVRRLSGRGGGRGGGGAAQPHRLPGHVRRAERRALAGGEGRGEPELGHPGGGARGRRVGGRAR